MNGQPYTHHLNQPLTEAEQAERTRLRRKARLEEKLSLLAERLGRFHRAHYSRWAALNALLPRCYRAAWRLPLAHTPRLRPPVPIQPGRLCRTSAEYSHLEELDNRHERPFELERHRYNPDYANGWIGEYDRKKQALTPEANLAQFAADELRDFEVRQAEEDALAEGARAEDPPLYYRMLNARQRRAGEFRQHVAADSERVKAEVTDEQVTTTKLTYRQIAFLHYYKGISIDKPKADKIAHEYGKDSKSAGQQIMQEVNKYTLTPQSRLNVDGKALTDMCKDIATVIEHLTGNEKQRAESELQTLLAKKY